jgi:hypothetical protein
MTALYAIFAQCNHKGGKSVLVLAQVGGLKPAQLCMPHVLLSFPVLFDSIRTLGRALFSGLLGPSAPIRCTLTEANPIWESFFVDHCQSLPSIDRRYCCDVAGGICRAVPHERAEECKGLRNNCYRTCEPVRAFYTTGAGPENTLAKIELNYAAARSRLRTASPTERLGTSKVGSTAQPDATTA